MLKAIIHVVEGVLDGLADRPDPSAMTCSLIRNGSSADCCDSGLTDPHRLCAPCKVFYGMRFALRALQSLARNEARREERAEVRS